MGCFLFVQYTYHIHDLNVKFNKKYILGIFYFYVSFLRKAKVSKTDFAIKRLRSTYGIMMDTRPYQYISSNKVTDQLVPKKSILSSFT